MKRIFLTLLGLIALSSIAFAGTDRFIPQTNQCVYHSSYTKTNDTTKNITDWRYLKSIIVSSATASGTLTVYNSSWTTVNSIGTFDLGTLNVYELDLYMDQGVTYTTTGNSNGVLMTGRKKEN